MTSRTDTAEDICVLAYVKGSERYVFLFEPHRSSDVLSQLGRFACNEDLSFTWRDAFVLSERIRGM